MSSALDGIRVLDFGQYVAGPLAAMLLSDQGADVIRIDPPGGQPTVGGDKHPEIGVAGQVYEERIQPRVARDPVGQPPIQQDEIA